MAIRAVAGTVLCGAVLAVLVVDATLVLSSGAVGRKLIGLAQFSVVLGVVGLAVTSRVGRSQLAGLTAAATLSAALVAATSTGGLLVAACVTVVVGGASTLAAWRGSLAIPDHLTTALKLDGAHRPGAPVWAWTLAAVFVITVTLAVLGGWPLGHDESVYALKARAWLRGTPDTGYALYRPPGVPVLGLLVLPFSDSELALRSVSAALTLAVLGVYAWAVREWFGGASAVVAVTVLAGASAWLRRATEFLNDIPSSGLTILMMALVVRASDSDRPRPPLVGAAAAAAAAFYLRYGVALPIAVAVASAVLFLGPQLWERRWDVAWASGAFVALLLPHFVHATLTTGSPFGIVTLARSSVGGEDFGLDTYLGWVAEDLAGPLAGLLIAAGLVWAATQVLVDRDAPRRPAVVPYLATTAVVIVVLLGLETHAEQRFVFTSIALTIALGSHVLVALGAGLPLVLQRSVWALTAGAIAIVGIRSSLNERLHLTQLAEARAVLVEASLAVARDAASDGCEVITSYTPQITWYSGCASSTHFRAGAVDPEGDDYLVVFEGGKRQPSPAELDDVLQQLRGRVIATIPAERPDRIGDATVYGLD